MLFLRKIRDSVPPKQRTALTIGNFDGMHLGHQAVLKQLLAQARQQGLLPVMMLFEPQPREWLQPGAAPPRLMRLRNKIEYLREAGLPMLFCQRFDDAFAKTSAEQFVEEILLRDLHVQVLIVGDDFRFGCRRQGDISLLQSLGEKWDFQVVQTRSCMLEGRRISSTWVRKALREGDLTRVHRLLGRPFSISGRVLHGAGRGHQLGFPTANMAVNPGGRIVPEGVWFSRTWVHGGQCLDSVSYLGCRPVFGAGDLQLETHLLAYRGSLYEQRIKVELLERLRGELPVRGEAELIRQVQEDIETARKYHLQCHRETAQLPGGLICP